MAPAALMTAEELLRLDIPNKRTELVRGVLRRGGGMKRRSPYGAALESSAIGVSATLRISTAEPSDWIAICP